jgi:hypothetical protein
MYLDCFQTTYTRTSTHFSPTPLFAGIPTPLPIIRRVIFSSVSCFLEYNQSYLPFCNSAPFCITPFFCCVSPDRHRVFSRFFWQSMSPSLAISCFPSQQHCSRSLLHSHYLWLMVSCQCMISSRPGWHIGTFCTMYCTLRIMVSLRHPWKHIEYPLYYGKLFHYHQEWFFTAVKEGTCKRSRGYHCRQRNTTQPPWCEWSVVGCSFVKYCSQVLQNDKLTTGLWCMASSLLHILFSIFPVSSLTL